MHGNKPTFWIAPNVWNVQHAEKSCQYQMLNEFGTGCELKCPVLFTGCKFEILFLSYAPGQYKCYGNLLDLHSIYILKICTGCKFQKLLGDPWLWVDDIHFS